MLLEVHPPALLRCTDCPVAAAFHTLALSEAGEVLTFGRGTHGQLGHGNYIDILQPTAVKFFMPLGVRVTCCLLPLKPADLMLPDPSGTGWREPLSSDSERPQFMELGMQLLRPVGYM